MNKPLFLKVFFAFTLLVLQPVQAQQPAQPPQQYQPQQYFDVPFVPTPYVVIEEMLRIAGVTA